MKKAVVSLIVTGMLVSLTACGSRTAKDAENIMGDTVTDSENMEDNAMKITEEPWDMVRGDCPSWDSE